MKDFTLSKQVQDALPLTVEVGGRALPINASFRTILRIFKMLKTTTILDEHKLGFMVSWFFKDLKDMADVNPDTALVAFQKFIACGTECKNVGSAKPDYCYEFDAPEILASFRMMYGIDLLRSKMHWWEFRALLIGVLRADNPLTEKIQLRKTDTSKCANPREAQEAKEAVQIPDEISAEEYMMEQIITAALIKGEDVSQYFGG